MSLRREQRLLSASLFTNAPLKFEERLLCFEERLELGKLVAQLHDEI